MGNGNPYTRARLAAGMSLADLVRVTGLSFSALWNVEQGLTASPNPQIAEALVRLGVDVSGLEAGYQAWRRAAAAATIKRFAGGGTG